MTWLEFFASIINNIFSWPVAVLLTVLILRKQLVEMLRSVESFVLEAGGAWVLFNRSLERAREGLVEGRRVHGRRVHGRTEATSTVPSTSERGDPSSKSEAGDKGKDRYLFEQYEFITGLALDNPSYAVEVAWDRLIAEQTRRLAHDKGISPTGDTQQLITELTSLGVVNDALLNSLRTLNRVRLHVATATYDPTSVQALEYTDTALSIGVYLNSLLGSDSGSATPG